MTSNINQNITHIYILLDRSGSMSSIANDVIGGFNRFIVEQQQNGSDAKITFVQFDSQDPQEVIVAGAPILEVVVLDGHSFVPRASTPLLDATGLLIGRARVEAASRAATGLPKQNIIFVTITDGEENQSTEYTLAQIQNLVRECEATGWTFVFLSAALNAYGDAQRIGVKSGSTQAFSRTSRGTNMAFDSLSTKTSEFREKKRKGMTAERDDFFGTDKPAEDDRGED